MSQLICFSQNKKESMKMNKKKTTSWKTQKSNKAKMTTINHHKKHNKIDNPIFS